MSDPAVASAASPLLEAIRGRRVERWFSDERLAEADVMAIAEAAARAPSGSGFRPNIFVAVTERDQIRNLFAMSPGMFSHPAAMLAICIDWTVLPYLRPDDPSTTHPTWFDIGAAFENALLVADEAGIGACPVTSFHRAGAGAILGLPETTVPYVLVTLGHSAQPQEYRMPKRLRRGRIHRDRYQEASDG